ncbi:MAG: histidine kinase N-terminal domain-containing protein, partial [Pseudoflavonifractor sp.]
MNSITRILCQKYTDLTDDEITYLEEQNKTLQALANAAEADAFIDCRTATGKSAIVVCEAKPQTLPSAYAQNILGMLIRWRDEPAVDRSFRLGIPTVGVKAAFSPEGQRVVQTVEPLFCAGKLVAVLIYEKLEKRPNEWQWQPRKSEIILSNNDWLTMAQALNDAVIFLDEGDKVCGYNEAAGQLYRDLGYVRDIMGMAAENIRLGRLDEPLNELRETSIVNHQLRYQRVRLTDGPARTALIIRDLTELRKGEATVAEQEVAMRELRHRMKNNLQMLASLLRLRSRHVTDAMEAQTVLLDTAGRLIALTATLDGVVQTGTGKVELLGVLERLRTHTLQTFLSPAQAVSIRVEGDEMTLSAETATSVALVVNELLQNALKYAFPAGAAGTVTIAVRREQPFCRVSVSDDGVGFSPEAVG